MALAAPPRPQPRLPPDATPGAVRSAAEAFATGLYAIALIRGATLTAAERADVVTWTTDLLGLPEDLVAQHDCRISITRFARELLREQGTVVGLYDAAATGRDRLPNWDGMSWPDPTLIATFHEGAARPVAQPSRFSKNRSA